ncbi:MAG: dihydrodipicolinate synthase family protein [Verrucomicrobia bacterium]|nr:dihydrodipicolinate synthase family protein [Verrucomicrobiota bacterium]
MSQISNLCSKFRRRIDGMVIPAVPVPFNARGTIDWEAQEKYAAWMRKQPIAGVAVWVHTGRGPFLTPVQRAGILRSWRSALGKGRVIVAGAGCPQNERDITRATVRMGEEAVRLGADALLVFAPSGFRGARDQDRKIVEHHRALAKLGVPLILFYLYEAAGGIAYPPSLLRELFEIEGVAGIKMATLDSVITYQDVSEMIGRNFPGQMLITGEDRMLGYTFMRGARAALIGMGAACTKLQADMILAHREGKAARFLKLSRKVDALAEVTFIQPMEGYIRRMLWALALSNIIPMDACYDPWGPRIPYADLENLKRVMNEIGELQ